MIELLELLYKLLTVMLRQVEYRRMAAWHTECNTYMREVEMNIDMSQVEYVKLTGLEIPDELEQFTAGFGGLMMHWLHGNRTDMVAVAVRYRGEFIGWSTFLREERGIYSLGTFIDIQYRGLGFGRMALTLLVECVKEENTLAYCKFGGSAFAQFNGTYERIILECGLNPASIFTHNSRLRAA
jgi:hypothetical protein